jgi:hypothetical protein
LVWRDAIITVCRLLGKGKTNFYMAPFEFEVLHAARKYTKIDSSEEVIAFAKDSFYSSEIIVFGTAGFYWHNLWASPRSIYWSDLRNVEIQVGMLVVKNST